MTRFELDATVKRRLSTRRATLPCYNRVCGIAKAQGGTLGFGFAGRNFLTDIDDPSLNISEVVLVYLDEDGDGHGDPGHSMEACTAPIGYTLAGDDCDDNNSSVYPLALEVCGDGAINNCAENDTNTEVVWKTCGFSDTSTSTSLELYGDEDAWNFYYFGRPIADVNGDQIDELSFTGCINNACGLYIVYGSVNFPVDSPPPLFLMNYRYTATHADYVGDNHITTLAYSTFDWNKDKNSDLIVHATSWNSMSASAIELLHGPDFGETSASIILEGDFQSDFPVITDDFDDDGTPDILFRETQTTVAILSGVRFAGNVDVSAISTRIKLTDSMSAIKVSRNGVRDISGDGIVDIIISEPYSQQPGYGRGVVFVFNGPLVESNLTALDADYRLYEGDGAAGFFGTDSYAVDDINGDGVADLLVDSRNSAYAGSAAGALFIYFNLNADEIFASSSDITILGNETQSLIGSQPLHGWDNDEYGDLLVIASSATNRSGYIFLSSDSGVHSVSDAPWSFIFSSDSPEFTEHAGGDFNGDRLSDILLSNENYGSGSAGIVGYIGVVEGRSF